MMDYSTNQLKVKQKPGIQPDLFSTNQHYDALHHEQDGTAIVWQAKASGNRWRKCDPDSELDDFLFSLKGNEDTYLTVNEFHRWKLIRLLKNLRAVYVDIDNESLTVNQALEYCDDFRLPRPSIIIQSGRGIHLYWLLQPAASLALPLWQRIENHIVSAFKDIGGDPVAKDCTRILRLAGTVNSKNGRTVEGFVLDPYRWPIHDLADEILGARPNVKPGKVTLQTHPAVIRDIRPKQKRTAHARSGSIYARWHLVYRDLIRIADYHGQIPEGFRETWLFLTANALSWFTHAEGLEQEIIANMKQWTPYDEKSGLEAIQTVLNRASDAAQGKTIIYNGKAVDSRYRFSRQTLVDWCGDFIPGELYAELRAIVPDEITAERKHERNESRPRSDKQASLRRRGIDMINRGKSVKYIMAELHVSRGTIYNWKKKCLNP